MNFKEIKIKDINSINDNAIGIYSWHLKPKRLDENKLLKIYEVFNTLEVSLSGKSFYKNNTKFGDKFDGILNRKLDSEGLSNKINDIDKSFINDFFKINSTPLYIGRSKDLKRRLNQHYNSYINAISINFRMSIVKKNEESLQENFEKIIDLDEESSYFGNRLANFNTGKWFTDDELIIRYYEQSDLIYDQIKDIEFYLNRLYKPILGLI
jgi:hypothetical protein